MPMDVEARAALYRDRLAGTRTLIVLDNAAGEARRVACLPEPEYVGREAAPRPARGRSAPNVADGVPAPRRSGRPRATGLV